MDNWKRRGCESEGGEGQKTEAEKRKSQKKEAAGAPEGRKSRNTWFLCPRRVER